MMGILKVMVSFIHFKFFIETKSKLIQTEINRVAKYLTNPDEWKDECEILFFLCQNKKLLGKELSLGLNLEEIKTKKKALQNLIDENILRQTSTEYSGKITEFHSPKYALAVKNMLTKY